MLLDTPSNQRDCPIRVCPMRESVNQRVCPISVSNQSVQRLRLSETSQIETMQMLGWSSCRCANICADPGSFQNDLKLLPGRKQVETCVQLSADGAAGMVRFYLSLLPGTPCGCSLETCWPNPVLIPPDRNKHELFWAWKWCCWLKMCMADWLLPAEVYPEFWSQPVSHLVWDQCWSPRKETCLIGPCGLGVSISC